LSSNPQLVEGTILNRIETGETHLRIYLFSGKYGLQKVLLRVSKGNRSHPPPDLFDNVEFSLNRKSENSGLPFVSDFQILKKRPELARKHQCFYYASKMARFYLDNGTHLLDTIPKEKLLLRSLDALVKGYNPDIVWFKTVFRFGRSEGLPVEQDWLTNLSKTDHDLGMKILKTRVSEQNPPANRVKHLIHSFSVWLNSETELRC
jgi:hypothetical protein